jgi:hypothetical protein
MKKSLLGLITCLSILISTSCTQTLPGGSNIVGGSTQTSWSCEIDGVYYSWSGVYPVSGTNDGLSCYATGTGTNPNANIMLCSPSFSGNKNIMIAFYTPSAIGSYICNPSNFSPARGAIITINKSMTYLGETAYSSASKGSFTVNVNTLSPNSYSNSGYAGAGLVTGTFSGNLHNPIDSTKITVTNGQFSSVRLN